MRFSALSLALNLPPLSKGGGLTERHKLLLCCFLLVIHLPFQFIKLFCRQDGGIALHPPTFSSPQPLQKDNNPLPHTMSLPPLLKVRCCRPKKFGRLPEGLLYHPSPRTITLAFRRVRVCVCLYGFVFALSHPLFVGRGSVCACTASYLHYPPRFS